MTLDEAYARYQEALAARRYSASTRVGYRKHAQAFLRWLGDGSGQRELTSVTRQQVRVYQEALTKSGLAKQTQAVRIRALKRWFEWLVERGFLFEAPTRGIVETPVGMKQLPQVLTIDEVARMLAAPNTSTRTGVRDRAVLELLYATGMRRGELVALDLADVDVEGGVARIRSGKGRKGRVVPFGKEAKRWLGTYLREARPRLARPGDRERALFLSRSGGRLEGHLVYRTVQLAARSAGVRKKAAVHALRHAFATHFHEAGGDIVTIQKILGHASPSTTAAIYTRVAPVEVKEEHARTHPAERDRDAAPDDPEEEDEP